MAKVSAHGYEVARIEDSASHSRRYRAMSDGVVLRQVKIAGKWKTPTIVTRYPDAAHAMAGLDRNISDGSYCFVNV